MAGVLAKSANTHSATFATHSNRHTDDRMSAQAAIHMRDTVIINITSSDGSTGKGILIGMLSAFGSAAFVVLIFAIFYLFRHTNRGRILLERLGRPGEYDDEQALAREEAEALEGMDDLRRIEYLRAKGAFQHYALPLFAALDRFANLCSFHTSQPSGDNANRDFTFAVSCNPGKGRLSLGV